MYFFKKFLVSARMDPFRRIAFSKKRIKPFPRGLCVGVFSRRDHVMSLLLQEKLLNGYLSAKNVITGRNYATSFLCPWLTGSWCILIQGLVISGMLCGLLLLIAVQTLDSVFFKAGNFLRLLSPYVSKKFVILSWALQ